MQESNSYVYFALKGDDFNPDDITKRIGIDPTSAWRKGDKGKHNAKLEYACWELATEKGREYIEIDKLVDEVVAKLYDKMEIINDLKSKFDLNSVLEIVLYIDVNEEESTPSLGHDLKTIEFLHRTMTTTDVDIYRFNSASVEAKQNGA